MVKPKGGKGVKTDVRKKNGADGRLGLEGRVGEHATFSTTLVLFRLYLILFLPTTFLFAQLSMISMFLDLE